MCVGGYVGRGRGPPNPGVACAARPRAGFTRGVGASGSQGRGSAPGTAAPETKDAAFTAGVDASALSFVSFRGYALVSGRSFHRDRFALVCRVSWRGRWGEPRVDCSSAG